MAAMTDQMKVLVFDDDEDICRFSKELLSRRGYAVMTAQQGEDAIHAIKHGRPHVAFLDIHAQGVSGMDVLRFARDNAPQCLCVMVTKEDRQSVADEAARMGAVGFMSKPVTVKELEAVLLGLADKVRREMSGHAE